jgi:hypothetical protein
VLRDFVIASNKSAGKNNQLFGVFILGWMVINLLQASFTGIYPDEAYYWVYSKNLQWGYFDHPPLVALFIKLGDVIAHNSLCTRLGTVMLSGGAIFFLFKALPEKIANVEIYVVSFLSVVLFHIYGFVATPDAALFFFTTLFFYAYRLYLQKDSLSHTVFLAFTFACLLYSKYHGILPVFFTFLSNPKLVFKPTAWLAVLVAFILFSPHIYWQYEHDWPTIHYHLSERVASNYRISKTTNYLLGQLLVWGPLTTIPVFYRLLKMGRQDLYMRAHQFNFWGVLAFFLLSSFNSSIEPHWTLVAGVSFIVLLQQMLKDNPGFIKLFTALAFVNIALAIIIRTLLVIPGSPVAKSNNLKPIFYGKAWADSIYKYAANTPVVFTDSYGLPALYQYYHPNVISVSFNSINYRKNHYSISDDESLLNNKRAWLYTGTKMDTTDVFVSNPYTNIYLHILDSFKAVNGLKIQWENIIKKGKPGELIKALLTITNKENYSIDAGEGLFLTYTFFKTRKDKQTSATIAIREKTFRAGYKKKIEVFLELPKQSGKYRLLYSIVAPPFEGTLASNFFKIQVE